MSNVDVYELAAILDLPERDCDRWTTIGAAMIERHSNTVASFGASYVAITDKQDYGAVRLLKLARVTQYSVVEFS